MRYEKFCEFFNCPLYSMNRYDPEKNGLFYSIVYKCFYCNDWRTLYRPCYYLAEEADPYSFRTLDSLAEGNRIRATIMAKTFCEENKIPLFAMTWSKKLTVGTPEYIQQLNDYLKVNK